MAQSLHRDAGSLLVVGLSGPELTALERAWMKVVRPGGVILFRRNIVDAKQTRALLDDASWLCATDPLRCVDVEGGTVDRLRDALASMPSAQHVAEADRARKAARNAKSLAHEHGELIGRGVKAFGFNTTLAPVLEIAFEDSAEVMGTRTAAKDASGVVSYTRDFLAGLRAQGVTGCGKHYPGLGGGGRDSHLETPQIQRTWKDLWSEDLFPYRELRSELPMVMVNHAAYPETKSKKEPASVSKFWITTVLRQKLDYRGLIFSDDFEMGGILKYMSIEEAIVSAIRAGMDMVEICHSAELILRAYEALIAESERSNSFRELLALRAREVRRKRAKLFKTGVGPALTAKQFEALRKSISKFRETVMETNDSPSIRKTATLVETA